MHVVGTCKNEENPIKTEGTRLATTYLPLKLYMDFSRQSDHNIIIQFVRCSRVAIFVASGRILPKFKLLQVFMVALFTFKNKGDPLKMKALQRPQHFPHYMSMGIFQDAQGQLTPQSVVQSGRISNSSEI